MSGNSIRKVARKSPVPVYQQIASDILSRICQEEWSIGDKMPSENELSEEYDASRVTIRQALDNLKADGLIDKQRGRGVFLKAYPNRVRMELFLPEIGVKRKSNVQSNNPQISVITQASAQVYHNLALEPGTPLVYLERPFLYGNTVVGINRAWFPCDLVPAMDELGLIDNSISKTLQTRYNIDFNSVENYMESVMLDAVSADQFGTICPAPGLKVCSVYSMKGGRPVEFAITLWNGYNTQFHVGISSN